jgi:His/Glu/Gln/Arg/opine family amino acid ABC transporter permease subunit
MEDAMIDFELIQNSWYALLRGTLVSLEIALIATSIGFSLGCAIAFLEKSKWLFIRTCLLAYVTLLRGTPMLVQILFMYYVLPQFGLKLSPFFVAALAIGLNSSAYISQSIRAGLDAVPQGQIEAAKTLGLTPFQIGLHIVFPQGFFISLPSLGNELITLVKDSSLASVIGVMELSKEASVIRSTTYDAFSILLVVSLIYLLLTSALSFGLQKLKNRVGRYATG